MVREAEKVLFWIFDCGYIFFGFTHKNIKYCVLGFNLDGWEQLQFVSWYTGHFTQNPKGGPFGTFSV